MMRQPYGSTAHSLEAAFTDETRPALEPIHTPDLAAEIDGPEPLTPEQEAYRKAGDSLNKLVLWLAQSRDLHSAGVRAFALVCVLRPESLDVGTQAELARNLKISKQALSKYVSELYQLTQGRFRRSLWMTGGELRQTYRARANAIHQQQNLQEENHDET